MTAEGCHPAPRLKFVAIAADGCQGFDDLCPKNAGRQNLLNPVGVVADSMRIAALWDLRSRTCECGA